VDLNSAAYTTYVFKCTRGTLAFMEVPITQFRREIFTLVNQALEGTEVWVTHKGRRVKIVPEGRPVSRLSRITPMDVINYAEGGLENTGLLEEMTRAWEADWDRDFGPAPKLANDSKSASRRTRVKP
jgi:antitoxin (DNA-binding transcriptional repressor) of toxin-antitoxin stability system